MINPKIFRAFVLNQKKKHTHTHNHLNSLYNSTELINRIDVCVSAVYISEMCCDDRLRIFTRFSHVFTKELRRGRKKHIHTQIAYNEFSINKIVLMRIYRTNGTLARSLQMRNVVFVALIIDTMAKTPRAVINLSIFIHQININ